MKFQKVWFNFLKRVDEFQEVGYIKFLTILDFLTSIFSI